jgi:hypothetical protein
MWDLPHFVKPCFDPDHDDWNKTSTSRFGEAFASPCKRKRKKGRGKEVETSKVACVYPRLPKIN